MKWIWSAIFISRDYDKVTMDNVSKIVMRFLILVFAPPSALFLHRDIPTPLMD